MKNIVLIWAGWTWMSGVAGMLHDLWFENLVCVDSTQSQLTDRLVVKWLNVIIGHGEYDVGEDDMVIYSEACVDSPEVQKAKSFVHTGKKPRFVMNYFEFLGEVSKYFKSVWFAGTNGKSSTSSLGIFVASKVLPNFGLGILWALVPDFGDDSYLINEEVRADLQNIFQAIFSKKDVSDYGLVKKYYFFVEACEYKRHFLNLDLDYVIVTNTNLDHTDYFDDEADYYSAFEELALKTRKNVFVLENDEWRITNDGLKNKLVCVEKKEFEFDNVFGKHWSWNGSFVLKLMEILLEVVILPQSHKSTLLFTKAQKLDSIIWIMKEFKGLWRRMELLGENENGAKVFTDYGHIAESIQLWYESLEDKFPDKKIAVIFQPHQMKRVIVGWSDFVDALKNYDEVVIYDIYAARENVSDVEWRLIDVKRLSNAFEGSEDSSVDEAKGVSSVCELGEKFSKASGWVYIDDKNLICEKIQNFWEEYVVVMFSAGNLDWEIRRFLDL